MTDMQHSNDGCLPALLAVSTIMLPCLPGMIVISTGSYYLSRPISAVLIPMETNDVRRDSENNAELTVFLFLNPPVPGGF